MVHGLPGGHIRTQRLKLRAAKTLLLNCTLDSSPESKVSCVRPLVCRDLGDKAAQSCATRATETSASLCLLNSAALLRSVITTLSKLKTITTEVQLREAARELLAHDPVLHWKWKVWEPRRERGADAVLELELDGRRFGFDVEFVQTPTARNTNRLAERDGGRPGLLIAPHLSETLAGQCRERGLNYLDLNGRLWLRAKGLLVERQPWASQRVRPALTPPDLFSAKSSRLARALLSHPGRTWSQGELVARTGLSAGLVSRLVRHLVNEGLLGQDQRVLLVTRADALLDAWAARDDWARRTTVRQYSLLEPDLEAVARRLVKCLPASGQPTFTQWFAANLRHPYTTPPVVSAYVRELPDERVERALAARRVTDGGTLWLVVPEDDGVFRETQRVGEFTLACDAQVYLDLLPVGWRGPEQAKALRDWKGFGKGGR